MVSILNKFSTAKNFVLYYGVGHEKELSMFDIAIVEPSGQSQSSQFYIQNQGVLALAYLSVMEIPVWSTDIKLLSSHDFIDNQYAEALNVYGNYMVDLRSKRWENLLMHKAGKLLNMLGYDGLFLDTIGNVEWSGFDCIFRDSLILAAARVVRKLRDAFPNKIIVQNNGLERLCLLTAEYLNGICWENPRTHFPKHQTWGKATINRLELLRERYDLTVLMLIEEEGALELGVDSSLQKENLRCAREICLQKGFLFYQALKGYVNGILVP